MMGHLSDDVVGFGGIGNTKAWSMSSRIRVMFYIVSCLLVIDPPQS